MEEGLMGGGHYECEKCGETVFGSAIHYCEKEKIKVEHKGDIKEFLSGETKMDKSLSESILNLYKTVTGKQDANYKDIVKEFCETSSDPIGDLMWKGETKMDKPQFTKEQLLEIYCLATDGDFNYFKNAMKYEKYDNDKTYEGPRCIYVDLKENMKPQFTEEQADKLVRFIFKGLSLTLGEHEVKAKVKELKEAGYIIPVKSEEPIIVGNVMSYKSKNYLKHITEYCDPCCDCSCWIDECIVFDEQKIQDCEKFNYIWKSFDDIEITDELACMRKDIGDVYIKTIGQGWVGSLQAVHTSADKVVATSKLFTTFLSDIRLATAEELQEYFILNKYRQSK